MLKILENKEIKAVYLNFIDWIIFELVDFNSYLVDFNSQLVDLNSHFWISTRAFKHSARNL